ncbi:MAG: hypothetical protein M4579_005383 [Chaenotheca gracillima]|nr:MAG: hypothetical protein M4579_005383 [Chaenotheca gracillima]
MSAWENRISELLRWSGEYGGFLHRNVELLHDEEFGAYARVRPDASSLEPGSQILSVPIELSLSYLNVIELPPFVSHGERFPEDLLQSLSVSSITAFYLAQQFLLRHRSFYWHYIKALPQPDEPEKYCTPLLWSDEDKVWLRGTNLAKGAVDKDILWKDSWAKGVGLLRNAGWDSQVYTWEILRWAGTMLSSRSFTSDLLKEIIPVAGELKSGQGDLLGSFPVMLPGMDILNHRPFSGVQWTPSRKGVILQVQSPIGPGDHIWNNYGPKSNEEHNPFEQVALKLQVPFTPRQERIKRDLRASSKSSDEASQKGIYYLRGIHHYSEGYSNEIAELCAFPHEILDTFTVLVANDRELNQLESLEMLENLEKGPWFPIMGCRNLYAVMSQLLMALRVKSYMIQADGVNNLGTPSNQNQMNAKIYRDSQLEILKGTIVPLEKRIVEASASREQRIPSLLSLESMVEQLRQEATTQDSLYEYFTNGLEAILGTSSIPELREAGWEDGVWTLIVCALKLWHADEGGVKSHLPSDEATLHAASENVVGLSSWIKHMSSSNFYGEPFAKAHSPREKRREDEDLSATAEELFSLIQDGSATGSSALFAAKEWSLDLLRWGAKVVMEEGLKILTDDDDPDGGPQYMLFVQSDEQPDHRKGLR